MTNEGSKAGRAKRELVVKSPKKQPRISLKALEKISVTKLTGKNSKITVLSPPLKEYRSRPVKRENYSKNSQNSVDTRWAALERFALESKGAGVVEFVKEIFPELGETVELNLNNISDSDAVFTPPSAPPELYQGLRGPESPPEFVKRVYAPWLGKGLDRAHIKELDGKLYTAIFNWSRKNEWPADVDLPTRAEQTRRTIDRLRAEAPDGQIGKVLGDFTAREAQRIRSAIQRGRKQQ